MTSAVPEAGVGRAGPDRGPDRAAIVISVALFGLAALVAYEGWRVSVRKVVYGLGPGTVPYFVGACLAILAVGTLIAGLRGTFPEREKDEGTPVLWIVAGLIAQLALLKVAGFSIATGILFAFTAKGMGRGPLRFTVPLGIVFCFVIWVFFTHLLNLSLPAGPIEEAFRAAEARMFAGPEAAATPPAATP